VVSSTGSTGFGTCITDTDLDVGINRREVNLHATASGRELHGIRQEIPDHPLQSIRVANNPGCPRIEVEIDVHVARIGGRTDSIERSLGDGYQIHRPHLEAHLASGDPRNVEEVIDELHLGVGIS
jgi:hypothetical protein